MRRPPCLFAILALAIGLAGCCKDCPVCPEPKPPYEPDYYLTYSYAGPSYPAYVLRYSTKTGEIVDSTYYPGHPFSNLVFSSDGEYACYTFNYNLRIGASETWVTRTDTGDTLSYLHGVGTLASYLSPDDQYLLLSGGPMLAILTFPDLNIIFSDSISTWAGGFHPSKPRVFVCFERATDSIFVIDFTEQPVEIRSFPVKDSEGYPVVTLGPLLVTEKYLILNPYRPYVRTYVQFYDVDSLTLVSEVTARMYRGVALHPDGRRLFLSYNGGHLEPWIGGIDLYNFETRSMQYWIESGEINLGTEDFVPTDIVFTPEGKSLFLLNGAKGFWLGPILEIKTSTKEVIRRWDHSNGNSSLIRLNPKDWAKE